MLYREAGQFKSNYAADVAIFPILQDRIGLAVILFIAAVIIPWFGSTFLIQAVMIPFLIFSLAAIGLNLLTGYTGLLSLGTGAFMGVGAYACYKLTTYFPNVNIIIWIAASGFFSAAIGVLFGLPSLRIKGFYLAVATLAAQFFLSWCFIRQPWFYNYNVSGAIEVPTRSLFGVPVTGATATETTRYFVVLGFVVVMFVHPKQIAELAARHPELKRLRLVVGREGEQDTMTLLAESPASDAALERAIAASLQSVTKLKGAVKLVAPGSLPNDGKIIADERKL